jgi:IS30 family transposase
VRATPSTVSRELRRNASTRSNELGYRATTAQWHAERRTRRPEVAKLAANDRLRDYVQDRLAGTIARPDGELVPGAVVRFIGRIHDEFMRISLEAIYQALFIQGRGALRRELVACLFTGRALRVPQARTRGRGKKVVTPDILISERPAEAEDRAVPGHWEGDLILELESSAIGTLVERTTRYVMLLQASSTTARYTLPSAEGCAVMSIIHSRSGSVGSNVTILTSKAWSLRGSQGDSQRRPGLGRWPLGGARNCQMLEFGGARRREVLHGSRSRNDHD